MALSDRCRREVVDLHEFFEGWLGGSLPDDAGTFARVESALAGEFEITAPSGETMDGDAIRSSLRESHGVHAGEAFAIRIEAVRPRFSPGDHCLLTYQEHQTVGDRETARKSTALFRAAPDAPNGVEWCHLQETWTPEGAPE